jgi:hypothetical protein
MGAVEGDARSVFEMATEGLAPFGRNLEDGGE